MSCVLRRIVCTTRILGAPPNSWRTTSSSPPTAAETEFSRIHTHLTMLFILTIILSSAVAAASSAASSSSDAAASDGGCQRITIPMCVGIGYNHTHMPNSFNHDTQDEAGLEVHQYWPLVVINCSADLRFFLCSVYTPICMQDYKGSVPACRSVCLRAKHGCEPVMTQYGFAWPERMSCERFPPYGVKNTVCMDERKGEVPNTQVVGSNSKDVPPPLLSPPPPGKKKSKACNNMCLSPCPGPFLVQTNISSVVTGGVVGCAVGCHFGTSEEERRFASNWIGAWASLCLSISLFTVGTFCANRGERFKYPERPVVWMSLCYAFVSVGYLVRVYFGHEAVACSSSSSVSSSSVVVKYSVNVNNSSDTLCVAVFALVYFFSMAAAVWWVTLSLTWYLAAGCKWGSEAISAHAGKYHLVAWTAPAVATILAIAYNKVDGDPVAGICLVGNQSPTALLEYMVVPLGVLLLVGTSFLLAGFIALVRIRRVLSSQGRCKTEKLEKLMLRIGVFGVLYALPAASVIATYLYEINAKQNFISAITSCSSDSSSSSSCSNSSMTSSSAAMQQQQQQLRPSFPVLMIKYFMSLAVGTTSGLVWIWSGKTLETWRDLILCNNVCACCNEQKNSSSSSCSNKLQQQQQQQGTATKLISHV